MESLEISSFLQFFKTFFKTLVISGYFFIKVISVKISFYNHASFFFDVPSAVM